MFGSGTEVYSSDQDVTNLGLESLPFVTSQSAYFQN